MIPDAFLNLIFYFIYGLLSPFLLLPDVSLPTSFTSSVATASSTLGVFSVAFPNTLVALIGVVGVYLIVEGSIATFKVVKWVYTKIPGVG